MLMTPALLPPAEPAAAGACAQADATLKMHAAARTAVRTTNLEFTLFSLFWFATNKPGRIRAKSAWLKFSPLPRRLSRAHCKTESIAQALCVAQLESKVGSNIRIS